MKPTIAFFGTSTFSLGVLDELERRKVLPSLIVTRRDRPKGRGLKVTPQPIKKWADIRKIEVLQPDALDGQFLEELKKRPLDLFIVASYGKIIPKKILDIPKHGSLNVHPSLLPKFRGPTPIQSAILNGEKETGVTIMKMDEKMDHGPIIKKEKVLVEMETVNAQELEDILAKEGARILADSIPDWLSGKTKAIPQNEAEATYTKKLGKTDGKIDFSESGETNWRKIRAFKGTIGTYFIAEKNGTEVRVKITEARFENGTLVIEKVLPESKKEMPYQSFMKSLQ